MQKGQFHFKLPRPLLLFLRVSVGLIFILMGSWKIGINEYKMGGSVGTFFTFMESTGIWWDVIGWSQVIAGLLLITQRFATIGAFLLFGITINIALVNITYWPAFGSTMVLTVYSFIVLSLLLLHDYDKWKFLFWKNPPVFSSTHSKNTESPDLDKKIENS